jgi:hypothetical protein
VSKIKVGDQVEIRTARGTRTTATVTKVARLYFAAGRDEYSISTGRERSCNGYSCENMARTAEQWARHDAVDEAQRTLRKAGYFEAYGCGARSDEEILHMADALRVFRAKAGAP